MPCINFLTEILPGPALAVFAFRPAASNSHNAAGFKSLRNTKQLVLLHSPGNQKPRLRGVLDFYGEGGKFALHKFPDGNFARARPRGVRLSACGLKLTQRCGLQIPTQHQAVGVAPLSRKPKTPLARGFRFLRRGRDLNPRNLAVYRFSRPAVSTTHTPLQKGFFLPLYQKSTFLTR